jgi:hypothetical protein
MEFFTPPWKSKSEYKRRRWIREKANPQNPKHQNILKHLSKNDEVFNNRQLAFDVLGQKDTQEALEDIAMNSYLLVSRLDATLRLENITIKTDCLVQLFKKAEKYEREKIANLLLELYRKNELSQENKAKILSLKGQAIIHHDDFDGNSCYPGHSDSPGTYFEV